MENRKHIAIIGCGFSGTMAGVQLITKATSPFELIMIDLPHRFNKGIAYGSFDECHLLNVTAGKMSAFSGQPEHFVHWLASRKPFDQIPLRKVNASFVPRILYGEYLEKIWQNAMELAERKQIRTHIISTLAEDLIITDDSMSIILQNGMIVHADVCLIATGNALPAHLPGIDPAMNESVGYFRNPWDVSSVSKLKKDVRVLILGNGLTMADTVI